MSSACRPAHSPVVPAVDPRVQLNAVRARADPSFCTAREWLIDSLRGAQIRRYRAHGILFAKCGKDRQFDGVCHAGAEAEFDAGRGYRDLFRPVLVARTNDLLASSVNVVSRNVVDDLTWLALGQRPPTTPEL